MGINEHRYIQLIFELMALAMQQWRKLARCLEMQA
jgi:hypothetical protein